MNILYLTYGNQSGVVLQLTNRLKKLGHSVSTINIADGYFYRYSRFRFPRISLFNIINSICSLIQFGHNWRIGYHHTDFAFLAMSKKAERIVRRNLDADIILQSGVLFSLNHLQEKPYILGILDNTYLIGRKGRRRPVGLIKSKRFINWEKQTYKIANKIFVMSKHVKKSLVEDYQISSDKIHVTYVGVNAEPDHNIKPLKEKYQSKKIVMIGMNFKHKGGYELIKAFRKVRKKIPDCKLIIIGDTIELIEPGVEFTGILDRNGIKMQLSNANLYVMPSHNEAFGIALIEAMAFSTPCIGNNIEAIPEIIKDGHTGFVIDCHDIDLFANKMITILNSPNLAKRFGKNGYNRYLKRFTWESVISKIDIDYGDP